MSSAKSTDLSPSSVSATIGRLLPILLISLVFVLGLFFRFWHLRNIPGLNADEAWWGNQILAFEKGLPWSFKTLTGKPLNPVFFLPIWAALQMGEPAYWMLKLPALLAGVLTIFIPFYLFKPTLGKKVAVALCLWAASSCVAIGYSRFGWDPSLTPLACLLTLAFSLREKWVAAFLFWIWSCWVHPTNAFLAPVWIGPFLVPKAAEMIQKGKAETLFWWVVSVSVASVLSGPYIASIVISQKFEAMPLPMVNQSLDRLLDFGNFRLFLVYLGRLITGTTVFAYIEGAPSQLTLFWSDLIFLSLFYPIMFGGIILIALKKNWKFFGLQLGLWVSVILFYALTGLSAIGPSVERYALFFLVPVWISLSMNICEIFEKTRFKNRMLFPVIILSFTQLTYFNEYYFNHFFETGGRNHPTFWTGPEDPKLLAYKKIRDEVQPGRPVEVLAENYWISETLRYLSGKEINWNVRNLEVEPTFTTEMAIGRILSGSYLVVFSNTRHDLTLLKNRSAYPSIEHWEFFKYGGKPAVSVWGLRK